MKCYRMLQTSVTAFTVSELLRENQQVMKERGDKTTQIRFNIKTWSSLIWDKVFKNGPSKII